jgi:hypothetical protein
MWSLRKNIIDVFDNRETEGVYVLDAAIAIDNYYGYRFSDKETLTKPYPEYPGEERIPVQTGNPHPYNNYPGMGLSLAAFIQRYRQQ